MNTAQQGLVPPCLVKKGADGGKDRDGEGDDRDRIHFFLLL